MRTYERHEFPAKLLAPSKAPEGFDIAQVRALAEAQEPTGTDWSGLSRMVAINERIEQRKALAEGWEAENPPPPLQPPT